MANIKINELKNTVTDEIIELRTDAANDSPESITAFKTLRQVAGGAAAAKWTVKWTVPVSGPLLSVPTVRG